MSYTIFGKRVNLNAVVKYRDDLLDTISFPDFKIKRRFYFEHHHHFMLFVKIDQIENILNQWDFTIFRLLGFKEIFTLQMICLDLSVGTLEDVGWL